MTTNFDRASGTGAVILVFIAGVLCSPRRAEEKGALDRLTIAPIQLKMYLPATLHIRSAYCRSLSGIIQAALSSLPKNQEIPCDPEHVVEVDDVERFLDLQFQERPRPVPSDLAALKISITSAYAFVWNLHFPIYVNVWKLGFESRGFDSGVRWLGYALAPLLVHERVHAHGEVRESVAHRAELKLAETFLRENLIPQGSYDVRGLEQVIRLADETENPELSDIPKMHVE